MNLLTLSKVQFYIFIKLDLLAPKTEHRLKVNDIFAHKWVKKFEITSSQAETFTIVPSKKPMVKTSNNNIKAESESFDKSLLNSTRDNSCNSGLFDKVFNKIEEQRSRKRGKSCKVTMICEEESDSQDIIARSKTRKNKQRSNKDQRQVILNSDHDDSLLLQEIKAIEHQIKLNSKMISEIHHYSRNSELNVTNPCHSLDLDTPTHMMDNPLKKSITFEINTSSVTILSNKDEKTGKRPGKNYYPSTEEFFLSSSSFNRAKTLKSSKTSFNTIHEMCDQSKSFYEEDVIHKPRASLWTSFVSIFKCGRVESIED